MRKGSIADPPLNLAPQGNPAQKKAPPDGEAL